MELKKCLKCKDLKPATDEYFYRKKGYLTSPCKDCQQAVQKKYQRKSKPKDPKLKQKLYRTRNKTRLERRKKAQRSDHRLLALWHYGGQPPSCACCGVDDIRFLCIGTVPNRQALNTHKFYKWLKDNGYPAGHQVLCQNCSHSRLIYGSCPHDAGRPQPSPEPAYQKKCKAPNQARPSPATDRRKADAPRPDA